MTKYSSLIGKLLRLATYIENAYWAKADEILQKLGPAKAAETLGKLTKLSKDSKGRPVYFVELSSYWASKLGDTNVWFETDEATGKFSIEV